jgi:predicted tellurium resistance membrane protein TerC
MSEGAPEWGVPDRAADETTDARPEQQAAPTPEGVGAQVRRRRRALVLGAIGVVLGYVVFVGVLSLVWRAWPTVYAWVLLAVVLVLAAGTLWPLRTPEGRAAWDERAGRLVRIDAALRDHLGIGEDERDDVTAAAQHRRQLAGPARFGYPLLVLFVAFLLFNSDAVSTLVAWVGTLAAVVLCGLGLLRSYRRDVEAKRWLAEPLPPEAHAEGAGHRRDS